MQSQAQHYASFAAAVKSTGLLVVLAALFALLSTEPVYAQVARATADYTAVNSLIFGLLLGVLLTACCYLFFIWAVFRDISQMILIVMLLFLVVHLSLANDMLVDTLGIDQGVTREFLQNVALCLFYVASIGFTFMYLDVVNNMPELRRSLEIAIALQFLMLLMTAVVDRKFIAFIMPVAGALTIGLVMLTGLVGLRRDVQGSSIHLLAFSIFQIGGMTLPMRDLSLLTGSFGVDNLMYFASGLSAIVFAVVVAGQFTNQQEAAARALLKSNERFALAAQGTNEGLFDWDIANNQAYFSDRLKRIVGVRLSDNPNGVKQWFRLVHAQDRIKIAFAFRKFRLRQEESLTLEYRLTRPDQKRRWMAMTMVALYDQQSGKLTRLVGSLGDITAKKQSEVVLKASEARFRSITEAHPVPVFITRLTDDIVIYASPGAEKMLKLPADELFNQPFRTLFAPNEACDALCKSLREHRDLTMQEYTLLDADKKPMPVVLSARLINYDNQPAAVIGVYDLTDRKQAEKQIAQQKEALQQSEKMAALGGLLAGVAHELNNPLSVIVGQATLLGESTQDTKTVTRADKISKAAERCSRIVKSFLAIARRKPPEKKQMHMNEVVASALELLTYQVRQESVDLKVDMASDLPAVIGDPDQMIQVITNLVLNAVQAMQGWQGTRRVTVQGRINPDNGAVEIAVADTGPGVPPEIRTRIFEPFFTTKAPGTGTGVGLSLCLNIVASHGGHLQYRDSLGGGATFFFELQPPPKAADTNSAQSEATVKLPKGIRFLLVDDEMELAQTLADLLGNDHSYDFAINGQIALEKATSKSFDVIISDLRMPVMDGPTFYDRLSEKRPDLRGHTIFVTGDTLTTHVREFLDRTTVPVIEKPYTLHDIEVAVSAVLHSHQDSGTLRAVTAPPPTGA